MTNLLLYITTSSAEMKAVHVHLASQASACIILIRIVSTNLEFVDCAD
jgi:hypothetical protein